MKDTQLCDNSATPPAANRQKGFRHFFEKQIDGLWRPITFRYIEKLGSYEYDGHLYSERLLCSMVDAGVLWPASSPKARIYAIKPATSNADGLSADQAA